MSVTTGPGAESPAARVASPRVSVSVSARPIVRAGRMRAVRSFRALAIESRSRPEQRPLSGHYQAPTVVQRPAVANCEVVLNHPDQSTLEGGRGRVGRAVLHPDFGLGATLPSVRQRRADGVLPLVADALYAELGG